MLEAFADRAAHAIQNARVHQAALSAKRFGDELLAMVSHDLRSPLSAIGLNAEVLVLRDDRPEATKIIKSVGQAAQLIDDLLSVVVIEAGALVLDRRPEAVGAIFDDVLEVHRPLAEARTITLLSLVEPSGLRAFMDRHRVVQAVNNLIGNAVKFTEPGGRVQLFARQVDERLEIAVSDTGPGIAVEDIEHLFDRFWQSSHARRAGAGLGLVIAKGCVTAHGGTIRVESQVGRGSIFTISLPLVPILGSDRVRASPTDQTRRTCPSVNSWAMG